jgi:hypothetical protein
MFTLAHVTRLRAVLALLLALVVVCAPPMSSLIHNPVLVAALEADHHAIDAHAAEHGHSHDHDDEDGHPATHGHGPFDHSHDNGQAGLVVPSVRAPQVRQTERLSTADHKDRAPDRLERPPRVLS